MDVYVDGRKQDILYCANKVANEEAVNYYGFSKAEIKGSDVICGDQYLCWKYEWIGSDKVVLQDAKFRKNPSALLSNQSQSRITFMHSKMNSEAIKNNKDCHWKMLNYDESQAVSPPRMSWRTWFGFGERVPDKNDDA